MRLGTILLCLAAAAQMQAGWITWTNGTPTGMSATGNFNGEGPAGTVAATVSGITDGLGDGIFGLDGRIYPNAQLTSSFLANYPVNADGSFRTLANGYTDSQDAYTITLDFSGLAGGYLPKGSLFTILDLDIQENYRNVTGFAVGGSQIGTQWLAAIAGAGTLLDWYGVDGDQTGSVTAASSSYAGGVYQFLGGKPNDTSALMGFRTTEDLEKMSIYFDKTNNATAAFGTGGPAFAIGSAVPEPGTLPMVGMAGLLLAASRSWWRRSGRAVRGGDASLPR